MHLEKYHAFKNQLKSKNRAGNLLYQTVLGDHRKAAGISELVFYPSTG